jgi:hypothetical protein
MVMILSPEEKETFTLGAEAEAALLTRIEDVEGGDAISDDELLQELYRS